MHNINAEDESLIREAEAIANGSALEAGSPAESESILSGSAQAANAGLAIAPVTPALVPAR